MAKTNSTVSQRFWAKVEKTDSCWNWTAYRDAKGYGRFSPNGKPTYAHRVSYRMAFGGIPEGMSVDHSCRNRACVRPGHLRLTTAKQNNENHSGAHRNSATGVRGVTVCSRSGKYVALVTHNGRTHYVGKFLDLQAAEAAVMAKRNELHTHNDLDRVG